MKNKTRNIILVLLLVSLVAAGLILAPSFGKQGLISKKLISKEMKNNKNLSTVRPDEANPAPTINIPNLNPPGLNPPGPAVALPACPEAGGIITTLPVYDSEGDDGISTFEDDYMSFYQAFRDDAVRLNGRPMNCPYLFEMSGFSGPGTVSLLCQVSSLPRPGSVDCSTNNGYVSMQQPGTSGNTRGPIVRLGLSIFDERLRIENLAGFLSPTVVKVFATSPDFRLNR